MAMKKVGELLKLSEEKTAKVKLKDFVLAFQVSEF